MVCKLLRSFVPFKPSSIFSITDCSKALLLLWIIFVIYFVSFLSLLCRLVCSLEPYDRLLGKGFPFVCDVFLCFVTFPYGEPGQVWYLIIWIPGV